MFGEKDKNSIWDGGFTIQSIAEQVFRDIQNAGNKPPKKDEIIKFAQEEGWVKGGPEYPEGGYSKEKWDEYEKKYDEHVRKIVEKFIADNNGRTIYTFGYADEDGKFYAMMEHSGIFDNLPHMRISCH
jgi:hypothetical protein